MLDLTREHNGNPATADQFVVKLAFLANTVTSCFQSEAKSAAWFRAVNPLLGGLSPIEMIAHGRINRLERWIEGALQSFNEYPM